MNRFRFLTLGLLVVLSLTSLTRSATPPNVLIFLSDDQGWGDLSVSGNTNLSTPNIDSLAKDGAKFDRFYVCPVCSPTRAEMLTGRYHPRGGVWNVSTGGERLNLDEKTIADHFRAAGYATGCFGKWHNGTQYPYHPLGRGFDEYYGFTSGHWGDYFDPMLDHNGRIVQGKGYITDDLTDHAMAFMQKSKDEKKPFFCYVPYNTPHTPLQVPDKFYEKFKNADLKLRGGKNEDIQRTKGVLAMCENVDWNVGRTLKHLDDLKIADNTIVLYFSDNGPLGVRWNGGMKGQKGSVDEGGVRSPLMVRWPGHIPPGREIRPIAGAIDLLPTLADLCDVPLTGGKPLDGVSLKPLLTAKTIEEQNWPARMIFSHWSNKVGVRSQQYRLDVAGHLYDMIADPGQQKDVTAEKPAEAARMKKALEAWRADVLSQLKRGPADDRGLLVGGGGFAVTQLPARDGVGHGNVQRSAKAPNCSYFTNWKSKDDTITWDVEVATPGRYEATIYYACPQADVGSTIELSLNGQTVRAKVTDPHDPPLRGKEHDRLDRDAESYIKDFKPMKLGTIELKPGKGPLTLHATEIPGKQVMEVRLVVLELVK